MGRHEAHRANLGEKLNNSFDQWLLKHNLSRPRLPRVRSAIFRPYLAFMAVVGLTAVTVVDPYSGSLTEAQAIIYSSSMYAPEDSQQLELAVTEAEVKFTRGGFNIVTAKDTPSLFVEDAGVPDPGSAKAFARKLGLQLNWGQDQYSCLVKLWERESNWRYNAENKSSGAYGIAQALPGSKMASEGNDWRTNAETQIRWGVKYILGRYKTPCTALGHSNDVGWY